MNINKEQERLSQINNLKWLQQSFKSTDMIPAYLSERQNTHSYSIYCILIPSDQREQILSKISWNFLYGDGLPNAAKYPEEGEEKIKYLRYGNDKGIEPLVICRNFHGIRENYMEISEEFRLFHNLYYDKKQNRYIKIDNDGNESVVATVEPSHIQIRLKEIRQFLAIKEMYLSIQFDYKEFSAHSLSDLDIIEDVSDERTELMYWNHYYGQPTFGSYKLLSRLQGKRLLPPLPKSKSGFCGFAEEPEKKYIGFIIGVDEYGDEIVYTSDPSCLAGNFGSNPDAPHYLTAVHFSKHVLDRYYQQPSKYSVEVSILRCGSLWTMYLDNHHEDKVCAWLGDLGEMLSYKEQQHWRTHNILPEGDVSEPYFRQQILNQFTSTDQLDHLFKQSYRNLQNACEESLDWQLLLPLNADDEYHFRCMRIPATDEQREFDELILGLTKILIDSLNEKQLNKLIPVEQRDNLTGSINRLEVALNSCGISDAADHISFLRKLQSLRSSSTAHRKGNKYQKVAPQSC